MEHIVVVISFCVVLFASGIARTLFRWGIGRQRIEPAAPRKVSQPSAFHEAPVSTSPSQPASTPPSQPASSRASRVLRRLKWMGSSFVRPFAAVVVMFRPGRSRRNERSAADDLAALAARVGRIESLLAQTNGTRMAAVSDDEAPQRGRAPLSRELDAAEIAASAGMSRAEMELMLRMRGTR